MLSLTLTLLRSWKTRWSVKEDFKDQPAEAQSRLDSASLRAREESSAQNVSILCEALEEPLGRKMLGRKVLLG